MRKAIIGDTQTVNLDFPEAKAGEVWEVGITVAKPDGSQLALELLKEERVEDAKTLFSVVGEIAIVTQLKKEGVYEVVSSAFLA